MNENVVKQKNSKGVIALIIILILLVIGMGTFIVYDKINEDNVKENAPKSEKKEEPKEIEEENKSLKSEITDLYKNKVKESNNLIDMNNIKDWVVTKVIYHGYNKNDSNEKYYKIIGHYSCQDNSDKCLYQEQVSGEKNSSDGTFPFSVEVTIKNNDITIDGSVFIKDENVVSIEEDID